jgi:phosphoglycolate phosphatase-like HAD superfamily hydrolase
MKTLFFDLDGTLIDINQREVEVISDTLNHFGLKASKTRVKQLCAQTPSYVDVFKKLGFELTVAALDYWTSAFVNGYQLSVVRRGVESTLKVLSGKYALACVTSRETVAEVTRELRFLHLDRFFNHVVTRKAAAKHFGLASLPFFPFGEQRRKLYEAALVMAQCEPSDAVAIGDMGRELEPARELGITTIGLVTYKARKEELQRTSDFLISRMTQLPNLLHELNRPCVNKLNSSC